MGRVDRKVGCQIIRFGVVTPMTGRFHCQAMGYCHKTFKWLLSSVQNNGPDFWVHEDDVKLRRATNEIYCGCGKYCNSMFKNHLCNSEQCCNNPKICHRPECLPTVDFDRRNRKQDVQKRKEIRDANRDHSVPFNPFYDTLPEVDIDNVPTEHAGLSARQMKLLTLRNEQKCKRVMISGGPAEFVSFAGIVNVAGGLEELLVAVFKRLGECAGGFSNSNIEYLEHERSAVNNLEAEVFRNATKEDLEHEQSAVNDLSHVERDQCPRWSCVWSPWEFASPSLRHNVGR